ncbi:MAG: ATP-binding protein [Natronomonas sp.]
MARAEDTQVIDRFEQFYREYYRNEIGELAQKYPNEKRSLYVDWNSLYRFDPDLADDFVAQPGQMREYAEEALRLYDLPIDVKLGQAHVRIENLRTITEIREIRARHRGQLVSVSGIIRKATDVRPKITQAAFECQRCGTLSRIPQTGGEFHEPHECQGCERQGPFTINFDQSEFVDAQKLRVQESPEGLRGGETPQSIDVHIEDDITGEVTAGDHVRVTGILHLDQQGTQQESSPIFDVFMEGLSVSVEDEQFEDMEITDEDKRQIIELSEDPDIYDKMVGSMAPSIYGYEEQKLAIIMQLFSGVTKDLPDGSRIRGDLHMLLIGDPGTGKCVAGDTKVTLANGREIPIRELVESKIDDPKPVDDGVYEDVDFEVPSIGHDGTVVNGRAKRVWKREAPERMVQIHTKSGREIEVTPSHPLFVSEDGGLGARTANDLTEGEFIAIPRRLASDNVGAENSRNAKNSATRKNTPGNTNRSVVPAVGQTLKSIRQTLGLTQHDCGLPKSTYKHYERGVRNPSHNSLIKVVDAFADATDNGLSADGGVGIESTIASLRAMADADIGWDSIESIEYIRPEYEWVYDLEVSGTHSYIANNIFSHNSQLLQYIRNLAPRSVYTSGKGSSTAGLTAAAVRDDFGDGQQWTLEAGALVLADQGIAAIDELDKMAAEDRSAMHQALEQQEISISKAGINATLKSRCSLLGAANPKYGRFDQYEPIGEQIELEPALISRFDLIFTVTDQPDAEADRNLAEHIIKTNYAGELNTHREQTTTSNVSEAEVAEVTENVEPVIEPELLRKFVAYAKRNCYPTMSDEAKEAIREFYVDLRARGQDADSPVPVTARKLEALVRLSEASARMRLSDTVDETDAERVIKIVRSSLRDIGVDPETGEFDADVVETGTSKSQRDRIKSIKALIDELEDEYDEGAPIEEILDRAESMGMERSKAEHEIEKLRRQGDVYEPQTDHLRTV